MYCRVFRKRFELGKVIRFRHLVIFSMLLMSFVISACSPGRASSGDLQPEVIMQTELGNIIVKLDLENAPVTAANFLRYVDEGRFAGATFYRVVRMDNQPDKKVKIEVIQGGLEFTENADPLPPIDHEPTSNTGIVHEHGTLSMARADVGTASSEIFICIGDQPELDFQGKRNPDGYGFAAFGRVIKGMDVVQRIQQQEAEGQMLINPVKILKVVRR